MLLLLLGIAVSLWASLNINSKFRKYSQVIYSKHVTAEVVANWILKQNQIANVKIERISGKPTIEKAIR